MRAVVIGAVESSRVAINAIAHAADWVLALVVTLPLALAGRHSDFVDLAEPAGQTGARLLRAANVNDEAVIAAILAAGATHLFVIGWSQICGAGVRSAAAGGTIGYHPAPLPRLRGRGVIPWTILSGDALTASTLFWIDDGVDSGPILDQRLLHVAADETAATLYARHMAALGAMLAETLPALAAGRARREPQDERFATWAARRIPADGEIDWTRPASDIARLIRAVGRPYPGARSGALTIWAARPSASGTRHLAAPGQIVAHTDRGFTVACGAASVLDILEWESADGAAPRLHARLGGARPCAR